MIFAADGGSGRLKVSRDQGRTFTPIGNLEGSLEGQIALDPDQPARMLAAAGGRVWRSDDEGNTWTRVEGPKGTVLGFHFDRTSPAKKRVCFAATPSGIWRSDDGGRAWADASEGLPWREVLAFSAASNREKNSAILYCAIESRDRQGFRGGVYRSADRGRTWASAMGDGINKDTQPTGEYADGPLAQYRHLLAADAEPRTVWAFNTSTGFPPPHHATAYRSDDAGLHWRATFYPDPRFPGYNVAYDYTTATLNQSFPSVPLGVAIAGTDPNVVLTVDMGNSYLTHDGGKTWTTGHSRPRRPRASRPILSTPAWSSPPPGTTTSIPSSPSAITSAIPTSASPARSMPAAPGAGGAPPCRPPGAIPPISLPSTPTCPAKSGARSPKSTISPTAT